MNPSEQEPDNVNTIADQNTERLLAGAYRPEMPDPAFLARVTAAMHVAAVEGNRPAPRAPGSRPRSSVKRWIGWTAAAGLLLAVGALAGAIFRAHVDAGTPSKEQFSRSREQNNSLRADLDSRTVKFNGSPQPDTTVTATLPPAVGTVALQTSATATAAPAAETLQVGQSAETGSDQRRRLALADGSVVYLNRDTAVTLTAAREVALRRGEIYVEVAEDPAAARFIVSTPQRQLTALGTKFDVRVAPEGTQLQVTQGKVAVSDLQLPVLAGQQLMLEGPAEGQPDISPAPRATHTIEWTRDLMAAAHSPLVPASRYSGGSLVAVDPQGQETRLSLRKYRVDVHIEDGFARTTIDQTYFNQTSSRLEGTFYFPLPPDASLSRLAMYVNGRLMEGGMAERQHAREVFDSIVYRMKDPALLEWVDGSTFKMRVFPLEGRQEKRIILSYMQRLPSLYGRSEYRFPGGHNLPSIGDWSAHVYVKRGAGAERGVECEPQFTATKLGDDLLLDAAAKDIRPDRDIVVRMTASPLALRERVRVRADQVSTAAGELSQISNAESGPHPNPLPEDEGTSGTGPHPNPLPEGEGTVSSGLPAPRSPLPAFSSAVSEGSNYLMFRWQPELPGKTKRQRRDWIFLFESSADRDPLLARTQIEIVKTILENAEHDDTFSILTAATRVTAYQAKPQLATPANVRAAVQFLENVHLIGALDLGRAFDAAQPLVDAAENPVLVHVGSGLPVLGEQNLDGLLKRLPQRAAYVGVGVGNRWSRALMKSAAARSGGYFTQINPTEPIAWRALDLLATLNTPRLLDIQVGQAFQPDVLRPGQAGKPNLQFLTCEDSLAQGQQLCAIVRLDAAAEMPKTIEITGQLNGKPQKWTLPVDGVTPQADYLPRTWAKLEIDRLVADGAEKNKARIIELSKAMYVMSPFTSLLVLENEEMYAQYHVDRGRKDHWAMYDCPQQIPVVFEPLAGPPSPSGKTAKGPTAEEVLATLSVRVPPAILAAPGGQFKPRMVPVLHASAKEVADILREVYADRVLPVPDKQGGGGQNWRDAARMSIDVDTHTNALLISAAGPLFKEVRQLVEQLDQAASSDHETVQSVKLHHTGAAEVQRALAAFAKDAVVDPSNPEELDRLVASLYSVAWTGQPVFDPRYRPQGSLFVETYDPWTLDDLMTVRAARQTGFVDSLYQVERFHVPLPDDPPILYPDAEVWRELTARRREIYGRTNVSPVADLVLPIRNRDALPDGSTRIVNPVPMEVIDGLDVVILKGGAGDVQQMIDFLHYVDGFSQSSNRPFVADAETWREFLAHRGEKPGGFGLSNPSPAEKKIKEALKQPTQIEFVDTPLRDVIDYLKDLHHVEIALDPAALKETGFSEDTPVTKHVHGMSLRSGLKLLLDELQLTWVIHNEVLFITTPTKAQIEEYLGDRPNSNSMLHWVLRGYDRNVPTYEAPVFSGDPAVFYDLLSYAPAMRTNLADARAVLEAEVPADFAAKSGKIDDRARQLIERARGAGWQTVTIADGAPGISGSGKTPLTVAFDGTGRYRCERTTSTGLREQVLCDGTNLWHLYPELGIGARRTLSRYHRQDLARLVPWALPPAEELAHGGDVVCIDERTVAIIPEVIEGSTDRLKAELRALVVPP